MTPLQLTCSALLLLSLALPAAADDGLQAPAAAAVWPQWQARITLQSVVSTSPLGTNLMSGPLQARLGDGPAPQRHLQSASLLGDYTFATPWIGSFRASGGVLLGSAGPTAMSGNWGASGLGLALNNSSAAAALTNAAGQDAASPSTYLGLGFSGAAWRSSLAFSADVGLLAERPGAALSAGRALLGNQGAQNALRELRLSPLLQVGLRYQF
jgi:hypothetical protein